MVRYGILIVPGLLNERLTELAHVLREQRLVFSAKGFFILSLNAAGGIFRLLCRLLLQLFFFLPLLLFGVFPFGVLQFYLCQFSRGRLRQTVFIFPVYRFRQLIQRGGGESFPLRHFFLFQLDSGLFRLFYRDRIGF